MSSHGDSIPADRPLQVDPTTPRQQQQQHPPMMAPPNTKHAATSKCGFDTRRAMALIAASLLAGANTGSCFHPHIRPRGASPKARHGASTAARSNLSAEVPGRRWRLLSIPDAALSDAATADGGTDAPPIQEPGGSAAPKGGGAPWSGEADAVICGGGPAGLLTAIMLAQKFPQRQIKVYDRLPAPYSPTDPAVWNDFARFYLVGLGGRGQTALARFGLWDEVRDVCCAVVGRRDWAPGSDEGVERVFVGRKFQTQVLPRDKLVAVLHRHIRDNYRPYQIELNHGYEVVPVSFGTDGRAVVDIVQCQGQSDTDIKCNLDPVGRVSTDLLVAADGTSRTVANAMEGLDRQQRKAMSPFRRMLAGKPFTVTRYPDDNQRVYKTIPMKLPANWRPDLNYSARSKGGAMNIDALPANREGDYCGVLLMRRDDPMAQADVDPSAMREVLDRNLPQFSAILDDAVVAQVAKKPPSFLPAFRFVGPRLNQGDTTVILGDCAHTVKPYFGLGANSALEDVSIFSDCIDETGTIKEAVREFSRRRARDSETLVRISRELDRPGVIGTVTFIIPIILDSIFNRISPKLFAPNIISMLQRDDLTFNQVARRKRIDRIAQLSVLGALLAGVTTATRFLIARVATAVGRRPSTVGATLAGAVLAFGFLKKSSASLLNAEMAPADVLAKMKAKITLKENINKSK